MEATNPSFKKHFEDLTSTYKDQICIHLYNMNEIELYQKLEQQFNVFPFPHVRLLAYQYDDLNKPNFLEPFSDEILRFGQYAIDSNEEPLLYPRGTFRISSMDCLDR